MKSPALRPLTPLLLCLLIASQALCPRATAAEPARQGERIYLIGDSTVANYGARHHPWKGWGQLLPHFIDPRRFEIVNRARGGRSSKSFMAEGLWDDLKKELQAGDYLLIQWGHNDRDTKPERHTTTEQYRGCLERYIREARAMEVQPILVTPMVINAWRDSKLRNVFKEPGNDYAGTMKEVATELNVPLVDLNSKSHAFLSVLDHDTAARYYYNTYLPGEYPNYPDGHQDDTHLQEMGALMMAKFVTEGLRELAKDSRISTLAKEIRTQHPVSIQTDRPHAGRVTPGTEIPEGAPFTLKAIPGPGQSFKCWKDEENRIIGSGRIEPLVMTPQARRFTAHFESTPPTLSSDGTTTPTIFMIGDSTMSNKERLDLPERGWGQLFSEFVIAPARIDNRAVNGRSTKTFITEKRWASVLKEIKPGDWLIIQFGHNDQKADKPKQHAAADSTYRDNLRRFISDARAKSAFPVLATSVVRRRWDANEQFVDTLGDYPGATRIVAAEENVPLLELHTLTMTMEREAGIEGSRLFHFPGDDTHFSETGARNVAALAAAEIHRLEIPLAKWISLIPVESTKPGRTKP